MLKECLLIVVISCLCGFLFNLFSPRGIALVGQWDMSEGVISAVTKDNPVAHDLEIGDIGVVKEIYDSGDSVFIDARTEKAFEEGHIKGAVSLPIGLYEERLEAFIMKYPPSTHIITYCSGRTCQDSHELAQILLQFDYEKVNVFIDGYPAWEKSDYPIEAGSENESG